MRLLGFIINSFSTQWKHRNVRIRFFVIGSALTLLLPFQAVAQRLSILTPEKNSQNTRFVSGLRDLLETKFTVIDDDLSEAAYSANRVESPFNMTTATARNIGAAIGCDYFLLVRIATQRRTSLKGSYYEASAALYVVSSRTGRLVYWGSQTSESGTKEDAEDNISTGVFYLWKDLPAKVRDAGSAEAAEKPPPRLEEMPPDNSPEAKNFRPPVPYKRIKPVYTSDAYLHSVTATVDLMLDLDEKGNILRTEVVRWAGYNLDETVVDAVRKMNWRPAERNGKPLPMRVLLRYNFKKIEKEE